MLSQARLVVVVGRATTCCRTFSTRSALLPKRHSRHGLPPTCLSGPQLEELTQELLESKPGSLYSYKINSGESLPEQAWEVADAAVQKTEFVLRGHAAHVPDTTWHKVFGSKNNGRMTETDRIKTMQALVERLEQEGELYMKLRHDVLSQVANPTAIDNDNEHSEEEEEEKENDSQKEAQDYSEFASPGPTIAMYDTLLDSMAVVTNMNTPKAVGTVMETIMERHEQDGLEKNTNIYTVPTAMTFNAVLRAIANTPYDGVKERTRDDALYYSFGVYDAMNGTLLRNSATYSYMLQTVSKYLPPCRSRGNIAHGLWMQARNENVVDEAVIEAFRGAHQPSNGKEFDEWMQRHMDNKEMPPKFRRNAKVRRHDKRHATY